MNMSFLSATLYHLLLFTDGTLVVPAGWVDEPKKICYVPQSSLNAQMRNGNTPILGVWKEHAYSEILLSHGESSSRKGPY